MRDEKGLQIYMVRDVLGEISSHASSSPVKSVVGILVGRHCVWNEKQYIAIRGYIKATKGISGANTFTITPESWKDIVRARESQYPNQLIVGWVFSHLDVGVFLGRTTFESHRNFFGQAHMVVLIMDSVREEFGFFKWKGEGVVPTGFWMID